MATFLDDADETSLVSIPLEQACAVSDHSSIASAPSVSSSIESPSIITSTTTTEDESRSSFSRSSCDTASVTTVSDDNSDRSCSPKSKLPSIKDCPEAEQISQGTEYIDAWETQILDYAIPNVKSTSTPTPTKLTMRESRRDSRESFQTHQRRRSSSWSGHQRYSKPEIDFPPMQSLSDIASESSLSDLSEISSFDDSDDDNAPNVHYHVTPPAPLTNRTVLVAYCGDTAASLHNNPDTTVLDMLDLISCLTSLDDSDKKFNLPHPSAQKTLSKRTSRQSINASSRKLAALLGPDFHGAGPVRPPTSSSPNKTSLFRRRSLLPLTRSPSSASLASSRSCDFRKSTHSSPRTSFLRAASQNPRNSFLDVPRNKNNNVSRNLHGHNIEDDDDDDNAADADAENNTAVQDEDEDDADEDDSCDAPPDILLAPSQHRWDLPYQFQSQSHHSGLYPHPPAPPGFLLPLSTSSSSTAAAAAAAIAAGSGRNSFYAGDPHAYAAAAAAAAAPPGYVRAAGYAKSAYSEGGSSGRRLSTRFSSLFANTTNTMRGVGVSHFVQ
jgi:hypothetical protein